MGALSFADPFSKDFLGGGGESDNSGEIARRQQKENELRIEKGTLKIDNAFAGYDDEFYAGKKKDYLDYYKPQADDQYHNAQKSTFASLFDSGLNDSSYGQKATKAVGQQYRDYLTQLSESASGHITGIKSNVLSEQNNLISQLQGGSGTIANAGAIATNAMANNPAAQFSPLGELFSQGAQMGANVWQKDYNDQRNLEMQNMLYGNQKTGGE